MFQAGGLLATDTPPDKSNPDHKYAFELKQNALYSPSRGLIAKCLEHK